MKTSDLGEFGLIERITSVLAQSEVATHSDRLAMSIGDDAAVWIENDHALIATTDTLVAGVHFVPDKTGWRDLGWKALAVNVSDIAAMGGEPEMALVTLALPPDTVVEDIEELYKGLAEASGAMSVAIAGGDIVRSPTLVITVTVTGRAELDAARQPLVLRRNAGQPGDVIAVTGTLGGAAAGLRVLQGASIDGDTSELLERHLRPRPRVRAGLAAVDAGVRCGMDVSDGLLQDLGHICDLSKTGAVVWADKLPIDDEVRAAFDDAVALAAAGGEDYELLLIGTQQQIDVLRSRSDVPVTVIGEMVIAAEHRATLLDAGGKAIELPSGGWDHLRGS